MRNLLPVVLSISFVFVLAAPDRAKAADALSIVDIRSNIPLSDEEPVYKDFYISGTSLGGLKKNLVVTAVRKIAVRDANGSQSYGDIEVPVGQLRILAVFGRVAVAREYQSLSRDEHPMLEQTGIMNGDFIELKGSFVDAKPRPAKRVSESGEQRPAEPAAEVSATAVVLVPAPPVAESVTVTAPAPNPAPPAAPEALATTGMATATPDLARAPAQNPAPAATAPAEATPAVSSQ